MRHIIIATILSLGASLCAFGQSASYNISTVAGIGNRDGGPATAALLAAPQGLALDSAGSLYIADAKANRVRKVGPDGTISTIAGMGTAAFGGDSGPAVAARLNNPSALAVDRSGNVYIADTLNNRIRQITPDGRIQ